MSWYHHDVSIHIWINLCEYDRAIVMVYTATSNNCNDSNNVYTVVILISTTRNNKEEPRHEAI